MSDMTVAELIELLQNESASIDTQFQLWITITSAVVIASFAARRHLSNWLQIFVAIMYILASTTIALRYANDAAQFVFLREELLARGVTYPAVVDLRLLRAVVYVFGSISTLVFIFWISWDNADQTPPDKSLPQADHE